MYTEREKDVLGPRKKNGFHSIVRCFGRFLVYVKALKNSSLGGMYCASRSGINDPSSKSSTGFRDDRKTTKEGGGGDA